MLTQRERGRNTKSIYSKRQHRFLWKRGRAGVQEPCPSCFPTMKGRLKGAWILSLLLAALFQPSLGQAQQEVRHRSAVSRREVPELCRRRTSSDQTGDAFWFYVRQCLPAGPEVYSICDKSNDADILGIYSY